jgi:nucleotide-binding universal stress UspA family protein
MYRHILLPTDGSPASARAAEAGIALAKAVGARATAMVAIDSFQTFGLAPDQFGLTEAQYTTRARAHAQHVLDAIAAQAQAAGVPCDTVMREADQTHQAIIDAATAAGCDLIVMGSHGRRGLDAMVLGSVAQKLLSRASLPVLVVR